MIKYPKIACRSDIVEKPLAAKIGELKKFQTALELKFDTLTLGIYVTHPKKKQMKLTGNQ